MLHLMPTPKMGLLLFIATLYQSALLPFCCCLCYFRLFLCSLAFGFVPPTLCYRYNIITLGIFVLWLWCSFWKYFVFYLSVVLFLLLFLSLLLADIYDLLLRIATAYAHTYGAGSGCWYVCMRMLQVAVCLLVAITYFHLFIYRHQKYVNIGFALKLFNWLVVWWWILERWIIGFVCNFCFVFLLSFSYAPALRNEVLFAIDITNGFETTHLSFWQTLLHHTNNIS